MLAVADRIRAIAAVAVLAAIAAAAWVILLAGAGGHDHASLTGWLLMIAAMMLPPEITTVYKSPALSRAGAVVAATVAVWTGFAVVALSLTAMMNVADGTGDTGSTGGPHGHHAGAAGLIASVVLIGAGMFQLSPVRRRLLTATRNHPSMSPWRHALHCLGGCWALMLVMVAAGLGNLAVMAALTVVMTVERVASARLKAMTAYPVGVALVGVGAVLAYV